MVGDFNQWLQDLVSDAVSVTPPPPELAGRSPRPNERRPWIGWAMAGAAAAVVVGLVVALAVTSGDDDQVTTAPVGEVTTAAPATTVATTVAATTSTGPATTAATTSVAPTTTVAPVAPPTVPTFQVEPEPSVVSAGADGVWVTAGAERVQWVAEPMGRAVLLADGLIVQRSTGDVVFVGDPADTALFRVSTPGGPLVPFLADVDWGGDGDQFVVLHDATVIDGVETLLVEVSGARPTPDSPASRLVSVAVEGDAAVLSDISESFAGWESGSNRLDLGTNGLIVGEFYDEATRSLFFATIGTAETPTSVAMGVDQTYVDCSDCPRLYSVSDDGTTVAWLDGTRLVRFDVVSGRSRGSVELGDDAVNAADLDVTDGAVVLERADQGPAILVTFGSGTPRRSLLSATSAGFGPDRFTTPFAAAPEFPLGAFVDPLGGTYGEAEIRSLLLGEVVRVATAPADGCAEVPRTVTRLDTDTIRVRTGCDDSVGGIDYRIVNVTADEGGVLRASVERRALCRRGVSGDLCV